jgi:ABC-type glycerol-3-phosphate transport system substrate-binding protein
MLTMRVVSRRALIRGLTVPLGGLVLAACAPPAAPPPAPTSADAPKPAEPAAAAAPKAAGQKVTVQFVSAGSYPPHVEAVVQQFVAANPTIDVEAQGFPYSNLYTKLETAFAAGTGPDVAGTGAATIQYGTAGWALALDPYLDKADRDDYFPVALECVSYQSKVYGLPWNSDGRPIFFRKDLAEAAGIDPKKAPESWETLLDYGKKLTKKSGDTVDVSGIWLEGGAGKMHLSFPFVYANGGKLVEADEKVYFDDPKTVEAVQWVAEWGLKAGVAPKGGTTEQVGGSNLAAGKVAIHISGPGVARPAKEQSKDDLIGAWPQVKRTRQAGFAYHNSNILHSTTKVRDEALKLLKHLSSTDGVIALNAPSRSALPRKSAVDKADWMKDPRMQLVQDAAGVYGVNEGRSRYWIPIRDNYWVPALDRVWLGQMSAEQACGQAAKEARDYIAKTEKK